MSGGGGCGTGPDGFECPAYGGRKHSLVKTREGPARWQVLNLSSNARETALTRKLYEGQDTPAKDICRDLNIPRCIGIC
jgi:hypothetical protein